jgi:hypothetical protein
LLQPLRLTTGKEHLGTVTPNPKEITRCAVVARLSRQSPPASAQTAQSLVRPVAWRPWTSASRAPCAFAPAAADVPRRARDRRHSPLDTLTATLDRLGQRGCPKLLHLWLPHQPRPTATPGCDACARLQREYDEAPEELRAPRPMYVDDDTTRDFEEKL